MRLSTTLEAIGSALVVLAAVTIAGSLLHREFESGGGGRREPKSGYDSGWRDMLKDSRSLGDSQAPISIVEFTDFQCPFCRRFQQATQRAIAKFPHRVSVALIHFPLPGHINAEPAARAAECAAEVGKFESMANIMFEQQDSLGKRSWLSFARQAGVRDTVAFAGCMGLEAVPERIRAGIALGTRMSVTGTPTVFLNGWRYGGVPSDTELIRAIADILDGKKPYKDFPASALKELRSG